MKNDLLHGLTDEQVSKVKMCQSSGEILALAKEEGVELSEEQLIAINGGNCEDELKKDQCPKCDSTAIYERFNDGDVSYYKCHSCGHNWSKTK